MAPRADRIDVRGGVGGALSRLVAAWRGLRAVQRRVAYAAMALLGSMLLPWYTKDISAVAQGGIKTDSQSKLAITVPSFVEAAIFLVAVSVLALMLARGERRAFHLPGGDGSVVLAAGIWSCLLIFYRFIDQPAGGTSKTISYDYGLSWGIFFGLLAALALAGAGAGLRVAHLSEPPLPGDVAPSDARGPGPRDPEPSPGPAAAAPQRPPRSRPSRDQAQTVVDPNDATTSTRVVPRRPDPSPAYDDRRDPEPTPGQLSFEEDQPPQRGGEH